MLEIHGLRVFLEAAKVESFTKAGQVLNLSQPAVSMQVRSLEDYLDVELFERHGRTIRLTKSGQALVPMARQLIQMALHVEENNAPLATRWSAISSSGPARPRPSTSCRRSWRASSVCIQRCAFPSWLRVAKT